MIDAAADCTSRSASSASRDGAPAISSVNTATSPAPSSSSGRRPTESPIHAHSSAPAPAPAGKAAASSPLPKPEAPYSRVRPSKMDGATSWHMAIAPHAKHAWARWSAWNRPSGSASRTSVSCWRGIGGCEGVERAVSSEARENPRGAARAAGKDAELARGPRAEATLRDANNSRGAGGARAARCLTEVLPADALGLVLYQLPLAHDIAAVAPTCHALCDAARAAKLRPVSGEVVTLAGHTSR